MGFFDPLPAPPPGPASSEETTWSPPAWDRPSEGTLPAVVPVTRLFARTDNVAFALDELRAYPNGFELVVVVVTNPRLPANVRMGGFHTLTLQATRVKESGEREATPAPPPPRPAHPGLPRLGVRFADGRHAGGRAVNPFELPKDDRGIPTEPVLMGRGGGGGGGHFRFSFWVFPLPPPGPLEVFAEWSSIGIAETKVVVSADDVRAAAADAVVLWS